MNTSLILKKTFAIRATLLLAVILTLVFASSRLQADTGTCGGGSSTLPFTDVPATNGFFCSIASAFFSGLTNGTSATTYSPSATVTREQMAAFITRTLDQSLKRGSQRAALQQFWIPRGPDDMAAHAVGVFPLNIVSDGVNLWVTNEGTASIEDSSNVMRVDGVSGAVTGTWTGMTKPVDLVIARSRIFVITDGGNLYQLNPAAPGAATFLTSEPFANCTAIAYDGTRLWVADGLLHAVTPTNPPVVDLYAAGLDSTRGLVYDGTHIWVTDQGDGAVKKVDIITGAVIQSVVLPGVTVPGFPCFDGTNIWVPSQNDKLYVVRVKDAVGNPLPNSGAGASFVLATLTGNGLISAHRAAFDGERVLVMNRSNVDSRVSLWKAADLTPISNVATTEPIGGVCSDGLNFWFTEQIIPPSGRIRRF